MRDSVVVEEEAIRVTDDLDPSIEGGLRPLRGRRVDHRATGVGAGEALPCVHEADAFGLVGLRRVRHLTLLGPEEEIALATIDAGLLGVRGCRGSELGRRLPGCLGGDLLGLVMLVIGYEETGGGTVGARDDLVELVSGVIDKVDGLVVLVGRDRRVLASEDLVHIHGVGDPRGDKDGHLVDDRSEPEEDAGGAAGVQFEKLTSLPVGDEIRELVEGAEEKGVLGVVGGRVGA